MARSDEHFFWVTWHVLVLGNRPCADALSCYRDRDYSSNFLGTMFRCLQHFMKLFDFFSLGEVTEGLPGANAGDLTPVASLGAGSRSHSGSPAPQLFDFLSANFEEEGRNMCMSV